MWGLRILLLLTAATQLAVNTVAAPADVNGVMAYIRSGDETLQGYCYKPDGKGPFPALVIARGATKPINPANPPLAQLAKTFVSHGYVVVISNWHVPADLLPRGEVAGKSHLTTLPEFQAMARDIGAAVAWAKSQAYVDEERVAIVGHTTGAILSLLLAQQEIGVRGYVLFSPAALVWPHRNDLQHAFVNSVREAKAPIFLIQAQNDYTLGASERLGLELTARGDLSYSKVYPPFGSTHEQGNNFGVFGDRVWGDDVFKFLQRAMN